MQKKLITFTKMHGLGNDFVIIDATSRSESLSLPIVQLADRHRGIGFDQLLLIEPSTQADFFCRIFNADGSEAEQCGNGLRCVARFIHENKLSRQTTFQVETKAGMFAITIQDDDHISVTIDVPKFQPTVVELHSKFFPYPLTANILSLGNPHAIINVTAVDAIAIEQLGAEISSQTNFPNGINIGFAQICDSHHVRLRTYERGVGETHACGSNACATAYVGILNGWLTSPVSIEFRFGSLSIEYDEKNKFIRMIGPATKVFTGQVMIE